MPDWTTHVGGAYIVSRPFIKKDMRFFLLGSILPDVIARFESVITDLIHKDYFNAYEMKVFHTPFSLLFLSLFIAIFTNNPRRTLAYLFGGSMFHLFLDSLQTKPPFIGINLFFPFSYRPVQFNLIPSVGVAPYSIWILCFIFLLYIVWEKKENQTYLQKTPRWKTAIVLFLIIFLTPIAAKPAFYYNNSDMIQFFTDPSAHEGERVSLYCSKILNDNPPTVEEHFKKFTIVTGYPLKKGDWVSVQGIYRNNCIYATQIDRELGTTMKSILSLPALFLFPLIWWDWRKLRE